MKVFSYLRLKTFLEIKENIQDSYSLKAFHLYYLSHKLIEDFKNKYIDNNKKEISSITISWSSSLDHENNNFKIATVLKQMVYLIQPITEDNLYKLNLLSSGFRCFNEDVIFIKCFINNVYISEISFFRKINSNNIIHEFVDKHLEFFYNKNTTFSLSYNISEIAQFDNLFNNLDIPKFRSKILDSLKSKINFELNIERNKNINAYDIESLEFFISKTLENKASMAENLFYFKEYQKTGILDYLLLINKDFIKAPTVEKILKNDWKILLLSKMGWL